MNILISPREVIETAFDGTATDLSDIVGEPAILAAQQKFIKPVLGGLFAPVDEGRYAALTECYLKPALAFYVKYLVLPLMSVRLGRAGAVQHSGDYFAPASEKALRQLRRRTRSDADTLMDRAIEYIEANSEKYPEYDRRENIRSRVSVSSGVVLDKR